MPSSYTSAQKAAIAQFVSFTQVKDSAAAKLLKTHGWNVEQAVDAFYTSTPQAASAGTAQAQKALDELFDRYTTPSHDPNVMDVDHSIQYLSDIGVRIDEAVVFTLLADLHAPAIGEFSRQGFIEGWTRTRRSTNTTTTTTTTTTTAGSSAGISSSSSSKFTGPPADDLSKQRAYVTAQLRPHVARLASGVFKETYKTAFLLLRPAGSKVMPLDAAIGCWETLLGGAAAGAASEESDVGAAASTGSHGGASGGGASSASGSKSSRRNSRPPEPPPPRPPPQQQQQRSAQGGQAAAQVQQETWSTPTTPWLSLWTTFLREKWDKAVSRDLWDQTLSFALKTRADESLGWWSEEGSWPGVIDEFVAYVKSLRAKGEV